MPLYEYLCPDCGKTFEMIVAGWAGPGSCCGKGPAG